MTGRAAANESAVFHFPFGLILGMGHPTFQIFAVEELHPALIVLLIIRDHDRIRCECHNAQEDSQTDSKSKYHGCSFCKNPQGAKRKCPNFSNFYFSIFDPRSSIFNPFSSRPAVHWL